jgi:hypothetical protein
MDKQHQSRAPLIVAIVLLLLPLLYVGSYLATVTPWNGAITTPTGEVYPIHYVSRIAPPYALRVIFRPLQLLDMQIRPKFWEQPSDDPNWTGIPY